MPGGLLRERTVVLTLVAYSPLLPFIAPAAWSWFRVGQRIWQRRWRESRFHARLLWTCLYTAIGLIGWALSKQNFMPDDVERSCGYAGQSFDESYYADHLGPLPPILNSSPCNEHYDLVAAWINPAIVALLLLAAASLAALATAGVQRAARTRPHAA